ncbi:hypothetical protein ACIBKX_39570 [Streptomyces sp. NPDC050658]|uniref:hypothetical protein n=1 Tax=unclassified Streptomyces TaxID=2593676 RepID=UPI00342A3871
MPPPIFRTSWQPGPEAHTPDPALVSVTEFTADGHRQFLPIALAGLRLRRSWPTTPGAVGMWLWADPPRRRSGSVSVWADERSLYGFVGRPDHMRTVRSHRDRGTLRATAWPVDLLDTDAVWAAAHTLLTGATPWPTPAVHTPEGTS